MLPLDELMDRSEILSSVNESNNEDESNGKPQVGQIRVQLLFFQSFIYECRQATTFVVNPEFALITIDCWVRLFDCF